MGEKTMTVRDLQNVSITRSNRWHKGGLTDWSALEWAGAMAGEAGEAANAAKKLRRIEDGIQNINLEAGRSLVDLDKARLQVSKEVADTILYGLLLVARVGHTDDFETILAGVFNAKSEEYGFPERIAP